MTPLRPTRPASDAPLFAMSPVPGPAPTGRPHPERDAAVPGREPRGPAWWRRAGRILTARVIATLALGAALAIGSTARAAPGDEFWDDQFFLGTGLNDTVRASVTDATGHLYVAGRFTAAGGVAANRIAKWDGSTWSALGSGMNGDVNALAMGTDGTLYAGGFFTDAGGTSANNIAA